MKKILILEDDREILELLNLKCNEYGLNVMCCPDPEKFINQLREHSFDFILSDYYIEHTTLLDILQSLDFEVNTPIIMMTGMLPNPQDLKILKSYNLVDILDKPYNLNDLNLLFSKHKLL